jgi:DNA-binding NarL/FixJ family response regulator
MHSGDTRPPLRVAIVDDHLIVRQGLKQYLAEFEDLTWAGEAEDGVAALAFMASTRVDVVLLDLAMPRKSGLEVLPELRARYPATHVVVVTGYPESHYGDEAKRLGAFAYLHKECEPLEIIAAIRAAGRKSPGAANEPSFA